MIRFATWHWAADKDGKMTSFELLRAAHFAQPKIEVFDSGERAKALVWLEGGNQ